jgi:hypothetical protein
LGGRAVDDDQINVPPSVRRRDLKSGPLCEYAGGPKVRPLPSQFFHFFIVEMCLSNEYLVIHFEKHENNSINILTQFLNI